MRKGLKAVTMLLLVLLLATGCADNAAELEALMVEIDTMNQELDGLNEQIIVLEDQNEALEYELEALKSHATSQNPVVSAYQIMALIRDEDWMTLQAHIHPSSGVRFSPYQYVDITHDQVFTAAQIGAYASNTSILIWGTYDGTGEPIQLSLPDYYNRFVYDHDFHAAPIIGNNTVVSYGNLINNIAAVYPAAVIVEFYYPQFDPQYGGMDWRSLTLVLEEIGGDYYLVGIVHGEWTI